MTTRTLRFLLPLALILILLSPAPARAATFTVTTLADSGFGSLRAAITSANANPGADTVTFSVSGTITLTSILPIVADAAGLTIDGAGQTVTLSGNHAVSVLRVYPGVSLTLNQLTIADGSGNYGGGIYSQGVLTITNSAFTGNSDVSMGGAICNDAGALSVANSAFSGNTSLNGGGIYNAGTLTITNSAFVSNTSTGDLGAGGAIRNDNGTATIANSTFSGNSATGLNGAAGAILVGGSTSSVTVINSAFSGNSATYGGGVHLSGGTAILRNTIMANSPSGGNCSGLAVTDGGNNLDSANTCAFTTNAKINTDPLLGALTGAPAFFPLTAWSPAIDGVTYNPPNGAPSTDQRGVVRPQGPRYDIGAYEYNGVPLHRSYLPLVIRN